MKELMKLSGFGILLLGASIWLACNTPKVAEATPAYVPALSIMPLPYNDTVKSHSLVTEAIKAKIISPPATEEDYRALNIEWQKRYMRAVDSARARKTGKDSVLAVLLPMRDSLNKIQPLLNHYIKIASQVTAVADQNKKYKTSIDYQVYIGFMVVVLCVISASIVQYKLNKKLIQSKQLAL